MKTCLFNSFNSLDASRLRRFARDDVRMHRAGRLIGVYRGFDDGKLDGAYSELNRAFADATVFQSNSLKKHAELGSTRATRF